MHNAPPLDLSTAGCHARAHQASLLPTLPVELDKIIVSLRGRRHRPNIAAIPKVGTTLAVVREVENPADTRALRCILCRKDNTSGVKEIYDDFVGYLLRSSQCSFIAFGRCWTVDYLGTRISE